MIYTKLFVASIHTDLVETHRQTQVINNYIYLYEM